MCLTLSVLVIVFYSCLIAAVSLLYVVGILYPLSFFFVYFRGGSEILYEAIFRLDELQQTITVNVCCV